jgi:hypothetical protein
MPLKAEVGSDFASVLSAAMQGPSEPDERGRDLPDGFPLPFNDKHRVIDTEADGIAGVTAYDFKIHRKVFTIFRPWESCSRCGNDFASGAANLPDTGDYECPHVTRPEYEETINAILAGKMLFGSEQEIPQKDGSVIISLRWYEKIPTKKKKPEPRVDGTAPEPDI